MVINSLSVHPCFKTLDPDACQDLDRQCTWLKTPAGAWVVGQADEDRDVYFVLTGRVRMAVGARCESVSSDIEAGSFFGELSALEGVPGPLSALALDDSMLARMPGTVFVATMFNHRPLGEAVVATLVVRNRAMTRKVAEAANIYGDRLASVEAAPWRPAPSRFDMGAEIRHIGANQRRARRWS